MTNLVSRGAVLTPVLLLVLAVVVQAQQADPLADYRAEAVEKWEADIAKLEARDASETDPEHAILFIGSSSIRRWSTLAEDMHPWPTIERGYGGARFSDLAVFVDRLVKPHQCDAIVIFVANDIAGKDNDKKPAEVLRLYELTVETIRKTHPSQPIFCLAVTPTSSRFAAWPQIQKLNELIEAYSATDEKLHFLATADTFLDANGQPRDELFVDDLLHLNHDGYKLWAELLKSRFAEVLGEKPKSSGVPEAASEDQPGTIIGGLLPIQRAQPAATKQYWLNWPTNVLLGVVLATLATASIIGQYLRRQPTEYVNPALVRRFRQRLNAWWLMCAILVFGLLLQRAGTVILFGLVSFWALREFITMSPTRRGDHRALFWALIVFTPLQYVLIGVEKLGLQWSDRREIDFYGLYSIMIPVYASLFVPARIAISGDHKRFLERSAQITVGLLICVYSLSYAPALVNLDLESSNGEPWNGSPAGLLFFFILVAQLSDILQWTWGHLVGRRVIAPEVSASRTWEGFAGGTLSTGLIGGMLFWVTPFQFWEAACMSMVIGVMGMFGGMTMSAIKRNRGVNDYGSLVLGHAGVLDRIDTLCFAAPVFYHLTRLFFASPA